MCARRAACVLRGHPAQADWQAITVADVEHEVVGEVARARTALNLPTFERLMAHGSFRSTAEVRAAGPIGRPGGRAGAGAGASERANERGK